MVAATRDLDPRPFEAPAASVEAVREKMLQLHGAAFLADPSGALYWPAERLLAVADLHFEKGSAYAARRVFLPPYDTTATLARLAALIGRLSPRRVVALGDSFHDRGGASRLLARDIQALRAMQIGRDWLWIAGNHDPVPPAGLGGEHAADIVLGGVRFLHEPSPQPTSGEIAGHLHPVAIVGGRGGAVRRRCFLASDTRCVLPAFGAYAGGLNILDSAFAGWSDSDRHKVHVLGRSAVYSVARHQCLMDATSANPAWRA